jgi:hypothetical protein
MKDRFARMRDEVKDRRPEAGKNNSTNQLFTLCPLLYAL